MSIERTLTEKYGPLLTLTQVAEILHRSPDGLRLSLGRDSEVARQLNPAKKKIGRRLYFKTATIAQFIES